MTDSERIAAAELLYKLCERMREELQHWPSKTSRDGHDTVRGTLYNSIDILEAAAAQTARGALTLEASDAMAEAGELTLRKITGMRKLRENIWPNHTNGSQA
jgi:hypothetical protein